MLMDRSGYFLRRQQGHERMLTYYRRYKCYTSSIASVLCVSSLWYVTHAQAAYRAALCKISVDILGTAR
jgi:hypothetical protein